MKDIKKEAISQNIVNIGQNNTRNNIEITKEGTPHIATSVQKGWK